MKRDNLVFFTGLSVGALHGFVYHLPWPVEFKVSAGLLLIGLGLFVVRKVP